MKSVLQNRQMAKLGGQILELTLITYPYIEEYRCVSEKAALFAKMLTTLPCNKVRLYKQMFRKGKNTQD